MLRKSVPLFFIILLLGNLNKVIAQKAQLIIPKGHTTPITLLDFNQKQMLLASSQGNNGYTIWNFDAEKEIRQIYNHSDALSALKFHPDFPTILSADVTGRLIVTDIFKNRKRSDIRLHKGRINSIRFLENHEFFVTAGNDSILKKVDYVDLNTVFELQCGARVMDVAESEGDLLLGLSNGEILKVIDGQINSRKPITKGSTILRVHKQGDFIITASENGEVHKISHSDLEIKSKLQTGLKIKDLEIISDSELVLVGRGENEIQFIDLPKFEQTESPGIQLRKELDPYNISIQEIHSAEDSNYLFVPDYDHAILCFDKKSKNQVRRFGGLTERIKEIQLHPNGKTLAVACANNGIRLYDLSEILPVRMIENTGAVHSVDFSPDGSKMAVTGDRELWIYDFNSLKVQNTFRLRGQYPGGLTSFLDDESFIKKDEKEGLTIFNLEANDSKLLKVKQGFQYAIRPGDGALAIKSGSEQILVYSNEKLKKISRIKSKGVIDFDFLGTDGRLAILKNRKNPSIFLTDPDGKAIAEKPVIKDVRANKLLAIPNSSLLITWNTSVKKGGEQSDYSLQIWDTKTGDKTNSLIGATSTITSVTVSEKSSLVIASSDDGSIRLWPIDANANNGFRFPASIYPLDGKELVTMMDNGVFDATRAAFETMHYVQGKDYISLDQLKSEYYEPHLLSKLFGYNIEKVKPRGEIGKFNLYPEIQLQHPNTNDGILGVDLQERGGGIGDVMIWINGKKAKEFEREELEGSHLKYQVSGHPFLRPNEINNISVRAKNESGDLISQQKRLKYIWNQDIKEESAKLYALIIGVSDYEGHKMDLQFASKDANDITNALMNGASKYFGVDNVEVVTLSSDSKDNSLKPGKENIREQFKLMSARVKPSDVFLFYFAGHGMQGQGEDQGYYLLTREASRNNTRTMENPEKYSISDNELANWLGSVSSHNMVMILDACHSGQLISRFNSDIGHMGSKEVRALEKLLDETGVYILAGSESEDVSYETSLYGQGLLTYSLLFGMKGEALRDGEYLDVARLFQFAAGKVPELANTVGGTQRPELKLPRRPTQIDIGQYGNNEKSSINLISPRPIVLPASFQEENLYLDIEKIGMMLNDQLKKDAKSTEQDYVFLNSGNFSGAYEVRGRYALNKNIYSIRIRIFKGGKQIHELEAQNSLLDQLIKEVSPKILSEIEKDFNAN